MHSHGTSNLRKAFWINAAFTCLEIVGGWYTGSLAILSDALHDMGDVMSLGFAWYLQHISTKKADEAYPMGYGRFSVLGAIINGLILVVGGIFILFHSIPRFFEHSEPYSQGMLLLAVVGIIFNGWAYLTASKGESANEKMASFHLLEDVLGWIVILIGSIVMYFTQWYWIDALLSTGIALYISYESFKLLIPNIAVLMQKSPASPSLSDLKNIFEAHDEICNVHQLQWWSMDGSQHILHAHVLIKENLSLEQTNLIKEHLNDQFESLGIVQTTISISWIEKPCCNPEKMKNNPLLNIKHHSCSH